VRLALATLVKTYRIIGSDILADPTSSSPNGIVTPPAREAVIERVTSYFPPELINRLDTMLVFNKLSRESILSIVNLRVRDVMERLKERRITLDIDEASLGWLADKGFSEVYGARAIARTVRTEVLFPLAQKLLTGTIRCGITYSFIHSD
jgi:ATP-dependent Clp protease ATP-binding subunit ClpB